MSREIVRDSSTVIYPWFSSVQVFLSQSDQHKPSYSKCMQLQRFFVLKGVPQGFAQGS